MKRQRLLIVDDSPLVRKTILDLFADEESVEIVGQAENGIEALYQISQLKPDVITMDISMPGMDGLSALKHLMIKHPTPVVMLSSLTKEGAAITFDALRFGAVDIISKPSAIESEGALDEQAADILSKIEFASQVEVGAIKYIRRKNGVAAAGSQPGSGTVAKRVVAIGAAEGGYGALLKIIPHLRPDSETAYLVTLYAAPHHVNAFARYLNSYGELQVKVGEHDEVVRPGVCYLNSGVNYMTLHRYESDPVLHVSPAPFASRKGSIDMMFFSTAEVMEDESYGVILSGCGSDGFEGLDEIERVGGATIVQDQHTALCKGMINAAMARVNVGHIESDSRIAAVLNDLLGNRQG
ncbi:MAG: response regulator [Chromatiales bacterium]|nr:response regulator [Chromatiales bacterium]